MDKIALGNFLAELRNEKHLTQEELAEILNISSKTISKWECGTSSPDTETLKKISELYNVSLYELITLYKRNKNPLISKKNLQKIINKDDITRTFVIKIIILVILFLLTIISLYSILYTINNYGKFEIYDISSADEDFYIEGTLIKTNDTYKLLIYKTDYLIETNNKISTKNNYIKAFINCNKYIGEYKKFLYENNTYVSNAITKIKINENINSKEINLKSFYLNLEYTTNKGNYVQHKIKLNLDIKYTNNKMIY